MCGTVPVETGEARLARQDQGRLSAQSLASLMARELHLGTPLDPVALRLFILAYWSRVSAYAHDIHNSQ